MSVEFYNPNVDSNPKGMAMTASALSHIKNQLKKRGGGVGVRLTIKPTGCSGFSYVLDFVDTPEVDEQEFAIDKQISIFVKKSMLAYVDGTELDFVKEGLNEKFIYKNPNAVGVCGCGESFQVE